MSLNIWNLDWLNQNANRAYPLHEEATGQDVSGTMTLPKDFLVDLLWPVHLSFNQDCERFHLYSIMATGDTVTITLGYTNSTGETVVVGSAAVNRARHQVNNTYLIRGVGAFEDSTGQVAVGRLDGVYSRGGGYIFDVDGGRIVPTCIRPNLRGVSGIRVKSGNDVSDILTNDVELVEGWNVRLTVLDGNRIRVDARSDANLRDECDCDEVGACIKTINGIPPDAAGNFQLIGDRCITLIPQAHGLQLKDECSHSCCGCDELKTVTATAEDMSAQLDRLQMAMERINQALDNFQANVLASKTNTQGCL